MNEPVKRAVLVTTAFRGVFFGFLDGAADQRIVRLTQARLCVYWSEDVKGFLGLAACGPTAGCRIGPEVPAIIIQEVTTVTDVTEAAQQAWNVAPWSK
jgi:hypothetical protein